MQLARKTALLSKTAPLLGMAALAALTLAAARPAAAADPTLEVINNGNITFSRNGTSGNVGTVSGIPPLSPTTTTYSSAQVVASTLTQESGGVVTGAVSIDAGTYNVSGGSVGTLNSGGNSLDYISGGTFGSIVTGTANTLDFFGTFTGYSASNNYTTTPVTLTIMGTLLNNTSPSTFNITENQYDMVEFNAGTPPPFLPPLAPAAVPEPSSLAVFALAGVGLLGLTLRARRQRTA